MGKKTKVTPRWQPLPEEASTLQVMTIPEVDDGKFRPEEMTKDELKNLSVFISQSNRSLMVENTVIEKYLSRMDPTSLEKMNQILEAAAIASQKAERAAQLGMDGSILSISRDGLGSKLMDDSSDTDTHRSGSSRPARLGLFGVTDKGPKLQATQKIEIVNREIDELKTVLDNFRKKARAKNYLLRCRNEEMTERLQEVNDAHNHFERKLLREGLDPMTGKLSGEKFIRYLEGRLKTEEMEIDKMRVKTGSLKAHLNNVMKQLAQKEELGEVLHAVDFEQLQIENRECQERLDEKIHHVNRIKRINGRYMNLLNVNRKKLEEQVRTLTELQKVAVVKDKMIKKFIVDEGKVNSEVDATVQALDKITRLMKSYTVPDLREYISKKAEVNDLKKEIKIRQRKMNIKELVLAGQHQKMKSLSTGDNSSKSLLFPSAVKDSKVFF